MKRITLLLITAFFSITSCLAQLEVEDTLQVEFSDSMHFKYNGLRYAFEENMQALYVDVNFNEDVPTRVNIMRMIPINGKYYPVRRIGARAFYGCRRITSVTIPDNIQIIDSSAFRWCVSLSNVGISKNVKRIGPDCFRNCNNLRNFHFPSDLVVINQGAFRASGLIEAILPESLQVIEAVAFESCRALERVYFPKTLKHIGKEAFANCWALKMIGINDRVRRIDQAAFSGCKSLKTVVFYKAINTNIKTIVAAEAFADCKQLSAVLCNTSRTGKVKDVIFHEESFKNCTFTVDKVVYGGKPINDPSMAKRKKNEAEFEDENIEIDIDNAERLRTSETVKRARKEIGVRKNEKKKKK